MWFSTAERPVRTVLLFFCMSSLLLVSLAAASSPAVVELNPGNMVREARIPIPPAVTVLNESNFDALVFPTNRTVGQAWFIFIYSTWCDLCKGMLPHFLNASLALTAEAVAESNASTTRDTPTDKQAKAEPEGSPAESKNPPARLAVLNADENPALRSRLRVLYYPTLLYTTGTNDPTGWGEYHGDHTAASFRGFARDLQTAVMRGRFAETIPSDPVAFHAADAQAQAAGVPFWVVVPPNTAKEKAATATESLARAAHGQANLQVRLLMEPAGPIEGTSTKAEEEDAYMVVVRTAQACRQAQFSNLPSAQQNQENTIGETEEEKELRVAVAEHGDAILVSGSDRFPGPRCFLGPWFAPTQAGTPTRLDPLLDSFLAVHGFRAVEELSSPLLKRLMNGAGASESLAGVIFSAGGLSQTDRTIVPVLRAITQEWNKKLEEEASKAGFSGRAALTKVLQGPRVAWAHVDGALYDHWRTRYQISEAEMPAVVLIDPLRSRLFRARTRTPRLEAIKHQTPWLVGGEQQQLLSAFVQDVLAGKFYAEKLSAAATLAEWFSHLFGFRQLYRWVGYEDFVFATLIGSLGFFGFLMFIALVVEPLAIRLLDAPAAEKLKKD